MKKLISYIVILALFFIAAISSPAIESKYKNNLLNVELNQTPDNRVSVLLVFERPYTDPVKVIYKENNEYNILLPETYHSITSISTINALNIRSASAKLVPYFNQENSNGYTKIVIKTTRPVIFNAHASYVTTKIAKDDMLLEKIEQNEPIKLTPTTVQSPKAQAAKQTVQTKKAAAQKNNTTVKKQTTKKTVQKSTSKQVKKVTQTKPKQYTKPVAKSAPVKAKPQQSIKPVQTAKTPTKTQTPAVQTPIIPAPVTTPLEPPKELVKPIEEKQLSFTDKIIKSLKSAANNENTAIVVLVVASISLLGLLVKVFAKTSQTYSKPKTSKSIHFEEETKTEIPNEIKNMSWQEKYKFMKEKEEANLVKQTEEYQKEISNNLDNIYNETSDTEKDSIIKQSISDTNTVENNEAENEQSQSLNSTITDPFNLNAAPINEGFEPANKQYIEAPSEVVSIKEQDLDLEELSDISDIEPAVDELYKQAPNKEDLEFTVEINEQYATKPDIEPTLINQAKISKTKGFYLIRYENEVALVGYIKDKIFFIHSFNNLNQSYVQTRLTEKKRGADIYLVRSDDYKALVQVSKDEMKTLINL